VQKYTGGAAPGLDKLGGTTWEKAKTRVKKAMRDMAEELLKLYAARKAVAGHAFSPNSHWQQEFDDTFEYDLTPDQQRPIATSRATWSNRRRWIACSAATSGTARRRSPCARPSRQSSTASRSRFWRRRRCWRSSTCGRCAIACRLSRFASKLISRFRSKQEQKDLVVQIGIGQSRIIVGTHRLLSKDVQFRDLGLLVVDEDQRFGVAHKERSSS
jgi:transcription-repair coupling factor (superfamily II helicase)